MHHAYEEGKDSVPMMFKSDEEFHYKTCVRGWEGKKIYCNKQYYRVHESRQEFDDSAWRQLVRMVPRYGVFGDATNNSTAG